jgi:hypothetical protein
MGWRFDGLLRDTENVLTSDLTRWVQQMIKTLRDREPRSRGKEEADLSPVPPTSPLPR